MKALQGCPPPAVRSLCGSAESGLGADTRSQSVCCQGCRADGQGCCASRQPRRSTPEGEPRARLGKQSTLQAVPGPRDGTPDVWDLQVLSGGPQRGI